MSRINYMPVIDTIILKIFEKVGGEGKRYMIAPVDCGGEYLTTVFADTEEEVKTKIKEVLQPEAAELFVKLWELTVATKENRFNQEFRHSMFAEWLHDEDDRIMKSYQSSLRDEDQTNS